MKESIGMSFLGSRFLKNVHVALLVLVSLVFLTTSAVADDSDLNQKIETLEKRISQLESGALASGDARRLSVGGVLSGAYQYQMLDSPYDAADGGHGAVVFQPEVSFKLTEKDELFAKFGFAAGNGLNGASPFALAPWAAPMEDDVKDINGRNRDYLLTAWYAHSFEFGEDGVLQLSAGIIDATDYLDQNAYSNDEHTQFMNEALVNAANTFFPSFDLGGAALLNVGQFEIAVVGMNVAENDNGNGYNFYGAEFEYELESSLGNGVYRIIPAITTKAFLDPAGVEKESRHMLIFSFDQEFGENFGAWVRFGTQDDKALVTHARLLSGGIDLSGGLWRRAEDNIGIGYAYLDEGNDTIESSQVFEAYYRYVMTDFLALTVDAQYMNDKYYVGSGPSGYVLGVRGAVEF